MTLLIILFILAVLWPSSRYVTFLVSNHVAGSLGETRKRLGGLILPILRGAVTAGLAELIVVPTYPLGILGGREAMEKGTPVLMVHGLFHNSAAWVLMKKRLRKAGFSNLHTYQYNSFSGEFDTAVEGLQRKLDALLHSRPGGKVLLVGHSLGGLVCRAAVGNPRFWHRIAGIVTLGTPHGGSDLARFGGNRMSRGLIPGREIPRAADAAVDPDCPKLAIYTPADDFVFPLAMLIPARPGWEEQICSPMGHVWMLYSREVADLVGRFLREAEAQSSVSG